MWVRSGCEVCQRARTVKTIQQLRHSGPFTHLRVLVPQLTMVKQGCYTTEFETVNCWALKAAISNLLVEEGFFTKIEYFLSSRQAGVYHQCRTSFEKLTYTPGLVESCSHWELTCVGGGRGAFQMIPKNTCVSPVFRWDEGIFAVVTGRNWKSVEILEVGSRHQNEACGNRWTWSKMDAKLGFDLHQILCQNTNF